MFSGLGWRARASRNKVIASGIVLAAGVSLTAVVSSSGHADSARQVTAPSPGYWLVSSSGLVTAYGGASSYGSVSGLAPGNRAVAIAATADANGYWVVTSQGAVYAFGEARYHGGLVGPSRPARPGAPVVGIAATVGGEGYRLVDALGQVYSFGDAHFYGPKRPLALSSPVTSIVANPRGGGYWLVASDGQVLAFGDAHVYGPLGARLGDLASDGEVVGMAATPDGYGYWLATAAGRVFAFGDAHNYGSAPRGLASPIVGIAATPDGSGYWLVGREGTVWRFGDAPGQPAHGAELAATLRVAGITTSSPATGLADRPERGSKHRQSPTTTSTATAPTSTATAYTTSTSLAPQPTTTAATGTSTTTAPTSSAAVSSTTAAGTKTTSVPTTTPPPTPSTQAVPGESYQLCTDPAAQAEYLTSPWTYDGLASGSQSYTVSGYEALPGYGTVLPPLPPYIASEGPNAEAAVIFAPGASASLPAYYFPETPLLYFFEGGTYGAISLATISGDLFIGGSSPGYPEPSFNDGGAAAGIGSQNDTFDFSGGSSTLASPADAGSTSITTASPIGGYISWVYFPDGTTYAVASHSGTTITLSTPLENAEGSGVALWASRSREFAVVSQAAPRGSTALTISRSAIPLVPYGHIEVGAAGGYMDDLEIGSVSGPQSAYTVTVPGGLDYDVPPGAPVFYNGPAGDVTVSYLDISHDLHNTTGTIYMGEGWAVTHDDIHDSYSSPGLGVAIYGGGNATVEYDCLSKMGDYGVNLFGANDKFDYSEIYESNYEPDPGCGCSGGGKWWGTLNADIIDDAFVGDSPAGGTPVWLDNGNSGTLIEGDYFYKSYGSAIASETGYDLEVTGNLFLDDGWGSGTGGCGSNCDGAVNLNSSGGFVVPGSRYEDEVLISANQFIDDWVGIDIWQSGARSCENSGEGWPNDSAYCSGGFPITASPASGGQYYFSHQGDSSHGGATSLAQAAPPGSSTLLVRGPEAIDDHVGFGDPASTTTSDKTDVSSFTGAGTINASSTSGFPPSGELRVGTSAAWANGGGSYTGATLSYSGTTPSSFTGVALLEGSGTLTGPIVEVQPYTVTAETCYADDCALTISPPLATTEYAGAEVTNAGTCQLYANSAALPSGPFAPDGVAYWDGCQWQARHISVTGNDFVFDPSVIASGTPLAGGGTSTSCTSTNADGCGTNFMAYQDAGEAPFQYQIGANAMMSAASFTGTLTNLNALATPPGAPAGNGEAPSDDVWSGNTYTGPWRWTAYLYGSCSPLPTGMSSSSCSVDSSGWQATWQQG